MQQQFGRSSLFPLPDFFFLGVQIENDVVHLRTYLVQLFALLQLNFEKVVQIIKLRRFGGAPNGYPFAALLILHLRPERTALHPPHHEHL
jgi:hypothetical protein